MPTRWDTSAGATPSPPDRSDDRSSTFAPLRVRSFRFPWPADPVTSSAFENGDVVPRHVHGDDRERPVVLGGRAPPRIVSYFGSIATSGFSPLST